MDILAMPWNVAGEAPDDLRIEADGGQAIIAYLAGWYSAADGHIPERLARHIVKLHNASLQEDH